MINCKGKYLDELVIEGFNVLTVPPGDNPTTKQRKCLFIYRMVFTGKPMLSKLWKNSGIESNAEGNVAFDKKTYLEMKTDMKFF